MPEYQTIKMPGGLELTNGVSRSGRRWVLKHPRTGEVVANLDTDKHPADLLRSMADAIDGGKPKPVAKATSKSVKKPEAETDRNIRSRNGFR